MESTLWQTRSIQYAMELFADRRAIERLALTQGRSRIELTNLSYSNARGKLC
jgi:hypothetical protein